MSGLYGTLNLGQQAVQTQRQGIELTGHNIANVDNPAFARQRLDVGTGPANGAIGEAPAGGVSAEQVSQIRNQLLDVEIQRETSVTAFLTTQSETLEGARAQLGPTFFAAPGSTSDDQISGLAHDLNELFNSFQALANEPGSLQQRTNVLRQAEGLAHDFNQLDEGLTRANAQIEAALTKGAENANQLLEAIAHLNDTIQRSEDRSSLPAHDLRDRRTAKLEELAELTHFTTSESDQGVISIHLDGITLVNGSTQTAQIEIVANTDGHPVAMAVSQDERRLVNQGELGAYTTVRDETLRPLATRLDTLAATLVTQVNTIHQTGFDLEGNTGRAFFTGNDAASLAVNDTLSEDPRRLQAAAIPNAAGDNTIIRSLSQLSTAAQSSLGNQTLHTHLTQSVTSFNNDLVDARDQLADQDAIQNLLISQRNAVSGVSLDEEMTNLVKYQNAFQASARLVSVIDEMLETVVNLGR